MINNVQFPHLGIELEVNRVAFTLGDINIYWYGICIALGMLLAIIFGLRISKNFGINDDYFLDVIIASVFMGIVGARAYYVIFSPVEYDNIIDMITIRDGGLAIYGGIILGFITAFLTCKWRKLSYFATADICAMGLLIGQGIGRWGNFFNQEAFGDNTNSIFGMISENTTAYLTFKQDALAQNGIIVDPSLPVHPTFLYESVWCLLGFVLLFLYIKKRKFNGEIFLLYIMWYGIERAIVEGLRTDSLEFFAGLRVSQILAILSAAIALIIYFILRKKYKGTPLKVNYDFKVNPSEKNSPTVSLTWLASEKVPTKTQIKEAYEKLKEHEESQSTVKETNESDTIENEDDSDTSDAQKKHKEDNSEKAQEPVLNENDGEEEEEEEAANAEEQPAQDENTSDDEI